MVYHAAKRSGKGILLVGDVPGREHLQVGDQLADRGAGVTGVPAQLPLELDATAVAQRAVSQLQVGALHLGAAVEKAVDLRQGQQPDPRLRRAVGHGQEPREQADVMPADRLVKLPSGIDDRTAAAMMLKGLTVQVLLRQTYRVRKSDTVLIHAAAGGVGTIAVQWAKHLGATVIAIVGSPAKADAVRALGADHVLTLQDDWVAQVRSITRKRGVNVVYDSVGKDTFIGSLDCLRPLGMMVTFGNASGPVPPIAPLELSKRGSLFLTRPTLFHYVATRSALQRAANELFDLVGRSVIRVHVGQTYPLQDAARAQRELEARRTTGSTVLLP